MTKMYSFTPNWVWYLFGSLALFVGGAIILAMFNKVLGTETVLETFPGTKSVCTRQEYNYSVKHTVCKTYASVPATCTKKELVGPIFDPIIHTECE